jgi:Putative peptidoglycan binding domain
MLQESSFARQTRRPIFSLEAVRPRQRVLESLPVIFINQRPLPRAFGKEVVRHVRPEWRVAAGTGTLRAQGFTLDSRWGNRGEGMFLASKGAWTGIALILLATGISGPRPAPLPSGANPSKEVPAGVHRNDVTKVQETLRNKGHYRGKLDGVFGLRTGAGIRAYQKAENLPVTGQIDTQTADKLGVRPEDREETGYETTKGKPSAYMNRAKGLGRTSKTPRKAVKAVAAAESGLEDRQKSLQAENDNHPQ